MRSALIYKDKLYTAQTHCQAYMKIEKVIKRRVADDEFKDIKSGFVTVNNVFISRSDN